MQPERLSLMTHVATIGKYAVCNHFTTIYPTVNCYRCLPGIILFRFFIIFYWSVVGLDVSQQHFSMSLGMTIAQYDTPCNYIRSAVTWAIWFCFSYCTFYAFSIIIQDCHFPVRESVFLVGLHGEISVWNVLHIIWFTVIELVDPWPMAMVDAVTMKRER